MSWPPSTLHLDRRPWQKTLAASWNKKHDHTQIYSDSYAIHAVYTNYIFHCVSSTQDSSDFPDPIHLENSETFLGHKMYMIHGQMVPLLLFKLFTVYRQ